MQLRMHAWMINDAFRYYVRFTFIDYAETFDFRFSDPRVVFSELFASCNIANVYNDLSNGLRPSIITLVLSNIAVLPHAHSLLFGLGLDLAKLLKNLDAGRASFPSLQLLGNHGVTIGDNFFVD